MPPLSPSILAEIVQVWRDASLSVRPGVTPAAIKQFQAQYDIKMPDDFASFYLHLDGMIPDQLDKQYVRFWTLQEICPAETTLPAGVDPRPYKGYFAFADYCIFALGYAIFLEPTGDPHIAVISGGPPIRVASDFSEFITLYLAGDVPYA